MRDRRPYEAISVARSENRAARREVTDDDEPRFGEVLTAMLTPFAADGSLDVKARPSLWRRTSSSTARTASSSAARPASRPP